MRLFHKLLLLTTLPLLLVVGLFLFITWRISGDAITKDADISAERMLSLQVHQIDQRFTTMIAHLKLLAATPSMRSGELARILPAINQWQDVLKDQIEGLYYTDAAGTAHDVNNKTFSITDRYYYPQVLRGEVVVTKAIRSRGSGELIMLLLVPITDAGGHRRGAIGATILVESLLEYVRAIKVGDSGFAAMIDQDGNVVSSLTTVAADGDAPPDAPRGSVTDRGFRQLVETMKDDAEGIVNFDIGDDAYHSYYATIPSTGWRLAMNYRSGEFFVPIYRQQRVMLAVAAVALLAVVLLTYLAFRVIVHPIRALSAAHEQVAQGDLSARAKVQSGDELGSLTHSFNDMTSSLQKANEIQASETANRQRAEHALRGSEERYRSLVNILTSIVWTADASGIFTAPQPSWERFTGQTREHYSNGGSLNAFHPEDHQRLIDSWRVSLAARSAHLFQGRIWHAASGQYRYCESVATPLFHVDGTVREWVGTITDVDDRVRNEQRQKHLLAELDHRVKNNLASVLGLAQQSLREALSLESFRESFTGRLLAMARSHEALASGRWEGVDITELARMVAGPFDNSGHSRLTLEGPVIKVPAQAVLPLSLTLHELATNAVKYGALGKDVGRVRIQWHRHNEDSIHITWEELDGPRVEKPAKIGLGTKLIQGLIGYELQGDVQIDYNPTGLLCRLRIPTSNSLNQTGASA